jgi:hypothetical protein
MTQVLLPESSFIRMFRGAVLSRIYFRRVRTSFLNDTLHKPRHSPHERNRHSVGSRRWKQRFGCSEATSVPNPPGRCRLSRVCS